MTSAITPHASQLGTATLPTAEEQTADYRRAQSAAWQTGRAPAQARTSLAAPTAAALVPPQADSVATPAVASRPATFVDLPHVALELILSNCDMVSAANFAATCKDVANVARPGLQAGLTLDMVRQLDSAHGSYYLPHHRKSGDSFLANAFSPWPLNQSENSSAGLKKAVVKRSHMLPVKDYHHLAAKIAKGVGGRDGNLGKMLGGYLGAWVAMPALEPFRLAGCAIDTALRQRDYKSAIHDMEQAYPWEVLRTAQTYADDCCNSRRKILQTFSFGDILDALYNRPETLLQAKPAPFDARALTNTKLSGKELAHLKFDIPEYPQSLLWSPNAAIEVPGHAYNRDIMDAMQYCDHDDHRFEKVEKFLRD